MISNGEEITHQVSYEPQTFLLFWLQVDFVWVNRDIGSFEWFLEVLAELEAEQQVVGAAMETFLSLHLYKTGTAPLRPSLPLASSIRTGRPDWDKVCMHLYNFSQVFLSSPFV